MEIRILTDKEGLQALISAFNILFHQLGSQPNTKLDLKHGSEFIDFTVWRTKKILFLNVQRLSYFSIYAEHLVIGSSVYVTVCVYERKFFLPLTVEESTQIFQKIKETLEPFSYIS
jgi:hypothetical protein